jgi:hypothetical protein
MRRWVISGVRAGLSTANPNLSKAEIRVEIRNHMFYDYHRCHLASALQQYTIHQLL